MRNWIYMFPLLAFMSHLAIAQSTAKDILLIQQKKGLAPILLTDKSVSSFYQKKIQCQLGKSCVYETRCGEFTTGAFREFGPLKGFFLAIDRTGRCTHITTMETLPNRLNREGKIIETPKDYRLRQ